MRGEELRASLEVLGLPVFVTFKEIRERYRELSKKLHPDHGGEREEFERIVEAYEKLKAYAESFKFTFSDEEVIKQYPQEYHAKRFRI